MTRAPPFPDSTVQLCAFFVGAAEYAIDIMRIDEILQPQRFTEVPDAPPWVLGVMNLREALVPVIDLRRRLGVISRAPPRYKPKWLVAFVGRRRVALAVDGVSEVLRVPRSALKPVPPFVQHGLHPAVIGACGPPDRTRLLLHLKALLQQEDEHP